MSRAFDLAILAATAPITIPLGLAAALTVLLFDGRPAFFRQVRLGRAREPFRILKLRTMREGHVTHVGRWLRRTGVDELPQLWNVARDEMRLVGPRAITASDARRLGWDDVSFDARWSVPPGIVGPSQFQAALTCDARLTWALDRSYVRARSLRRDVALLAAAAISVVAGRAAAARFLGMERRRG